MNIVFDLGGVVFNWRPDRIIRHVFQDSETQQMVKAEIFQHSDWIELDRGTMSLDQAIIQAISRTGLSREEIQELFDEVLRSLTPIQGSIDLIRALSDSEHRVFVLSNMSHTSIAYLENRHNFWDLFDGIVISCRIQKVKPELGIFEHLLNHYQLDPGETIFIDDTIENLTAASSLGIQTIKFVDSGQCRQALANLNCI